MNNIIPKFKMIKLLTNIQTYIHTYMDDNMKRETATSTLSGGQRTIEELITSMMNVIGEEAPTITLLL